MAQVRPQKVPTGADNLGARGLYAMVCYYYPQYTLKDVQALPGRDVALLLKTARRQQGAFLYNLTQIVQAPHSKKQSNVKHLLEQFRKQAEA